MWGGGGKKIKKKTFDPATQANSQADKGSQQHKACFDETKKGEISFSITDTARPSPSHNPM